MPMPWQLARGLWARRQSRRREPRPIAETLPHINVNDLDVPHDHKTYTSNLSLRYGFITGMKVNWFMVQLFHSDRVQSFKLKWIKTGFGFPRPAFICDQCGRATIKLYFKHQNLGCRTCCNVIYASQTRNKRGRSTLKAVRLRNFLELKSGMSKRNRQRLKTRISPTSTQELKTKRLAHHRIQIPVHNYNTRGAAHWL